MPRIQTNELEKELMELFDLRRSLFQVNHKLNYELALAQKDIRLLTLKFSDGIPDLELQVSEEESLKWDSKIKKLLYIQNRSSQYIESASKETIVRMRPYLKSLVQKARAYYEELNPFERDY